jgi:membrane-associated phospholipid phosphatase
MLVPGWLRRPAVALLAACLAAAVLTGARSARYRLPQWLDAALDPRIRSSLDRFPALLDWLDRLDGIGSLIPVTAITVALILACAVTHRWRGAVLAAVAVPAAVVLTEYVLKPAVGAAIGQAFPSGHATSMFALAACSAVLLAAPSRPRLPGAGRLLLALAAVLLAAAVAVGVVATGEHRFTDVVGGAAVGTGVVLACALTLDWLGRRRRPGPAAPPAPGARSAAARPARSPVPPRPPTPS